MRKEEIISGTSKYLMNTYGRYPIAMVRGKGAWVWDSEGKKYLDFVTGIAVNNLGHCHPSVVRAISEQSRKLVQVCNLYHMEKQVEFAKMLVENSFADKVFFCNSGAEANEGAIKLARKWGGAGGGRYKIVHARDSFHGRTLGALSATSKKYQKGFEPLVPGFKSIPYGRIEPLERALEDEKVCAVILEPIQGENGVIVPYAKYLRDARKLCKRKNVLLILDEIQVGLGRTGKLFAYEHYGVKPDIMTLAKALGGGIPCGAILAADAVAKHLSPSNHGTTLGGNPLAMSAGIAVLKTIIEDGLLDNAAGMGEYFLSGLRAVKDEFGDLVRDVRGKGLILGVEFVNAETAKDVVVRCSNNGLLTILTEQKVMRILPPLIVKKNEIDHALKIIRRSLKEVTVA
ncbi:MAG TPA: ornithine--oxo-acid transaminase [Thermodesulfobacteriota bacterium]|nr:ornithine--oxo-acid transaminase [Thermodesulfobacteriota bacterium]